ncbi:amino acid ABC transporter ATP-binding/permease protein [Marinomonas algarum]|uniref:ATP-binding cassette domain-containing protein n=1 Tax=Marinomonas algarum TaxID=2883105 RepID=A0A9X1ILY0_9GAMM|nr:ATP-binding cassette domain-containing protein [Marinomonas algarum]MCB5160701.1 ATP-binding cassette domain-containing protein [Marinomonas algarum]
MKKTSKLTLKRLLLANPWGLALPVLVGTIASLSGIALLGVSGWFITGAGLATAIGANLVFNYLTPGAIVRGLSIFRTAGRYGEQVSSHNHLLGLLKTLRLWVWDQRVAKDAANLYEQTRGDLLQRLVSDLDQVMRWPLVVFLPWIYAFFSYFAVGIFAYFLSPDLMLPMAIAALLHIIVVPYVCGQFSSHQVHIGQILGVHRRSRFVSLFSALITLTIRGHWKDYAKRLGQLDERQRLTEIRIQNTVSTGRFFVYMVTILLIAISMYLMSDMDPSTGRLVLLEGIQGTWVVGFVLCLLALNELMLPLVQSFVAQGQSQVGLRRLNQLHHVSGAHSDTLFHSDTTMQAGVTTMTFEHWRGYHASSGMGNTPLDLSIKSGDTLWIRGSSGSGKSTLLASIAGDCLSTGRAMINGDACEPYDNALYQKQLSYLPQHPYIFQQSIAANLRMGCPEANEAELWSVLEAVSLADWVESLPGKLETLLSSQGRNLSGGQRKRLALARLLLRKAPVLLLDEPFDGLDKATIEVLCQSLQNDYKPEILVLVSHIESRIGDSARVVML